MPRKRGFIQWPWRSRATIAREVDAELAFHLEMRVAELVSAGVDAESAREQARREFGDIEFTRTYCRRMDVDNDRSARVAESLDESRREVRQAIRALRR